MSTDASVLAFAIGLLCFIIIMVVGWRTAKTANGRQRLEMVLQTGSVQFKNRRSMQSMNQVQIEKRLKQIERDTKDNQQNSRRSLEDRLAEAGWRMSRKGFILFSGITCVIFVLLMLLVSDDGTIRLLSIPIGALGLPNMILNMARRRRRRHFLRDLADCLEAIVRGLKSGLPVGEAMAMIAREFQGPVAEEFTRVVDEQAIGMTLGESLERAAKRMPIPEVRMLAIAISIQSRTGGSLAETLMNLADVIRSRTRLARKVKAVSSEAKVSAMIIGALPCLVTLGLYAANPEYIMLLFTDPTGVVMLIGCLTWMGLGILVMWRMVNFKV